MRRRSFLGLIPAVPVALNALEPIRPIPKVCALSECASLWPTPKAELCTVMFRLPRKAFLAGGASWNGFTLRRAELEVHLMVTTWAGDANFQYVEAVCDWDKAIRILAGNEGKLFHGEIAYRARAEFAMFPPHSRQAFLELL